LGILQLIANKDIVPLSPLGFGANFGRIVTACDSRVTAALQLRHHVKRGNYQSSLVDLYFRLENVTNNPVP